MNKDNHTYFEFEISLFYELSIYLITNNSAYVYVLWVLSDVLQSMFSWGAAPAQGPPGFVLELHRDF